MITVHPIDTGAARRWNLVGLPAGVRRYQDTGEVAIFVQRSFMRGRPWLRFSLRFDPCGDDRWRVTAYKTRTEAIKGG